MTRYFFIRAGFVLLICSAFSLAVAYGQSDSPTMTADPQIAAALKQVSATRIRPTLRSW
jgi:hypothetical protein